MASQIPADTVEEIRERHQWLRDLRSSDMDDADRQTDGAIDTQVAKEFGVSRVYVARLVDGSARPEAPGPIDHRRAQEAVLYGQEVESLGQTEAARRRRLRRRGIDPDPKTPRLVQRVTVVGHRGIDTGMVAFLEPGQSLRVDLVTEGGVR